MSSLAVKMSIPPKRLVSAFHLYLCERLTQPPKFSGNPQRLPRIGGRFSSLRFKRLERMMRDKYPNLLAILPLFMFCGRNQRVCPIKSLSGMQLITQVDMNKFTMRSLQNGFSKMIESESSFALEFNSESEQIAVLVFVFKNGKLFMKMEIHSRMVGKLQEFDWEEIIVKTTVHTVDLLHKNNDIGGLRFFYTTKINLSDFYPQLPDFNRCNLVTIYKGN